ncbi:TetR family transcriptional regulator [Sphingomonas sp. MAH-20]|uniref:TetR family transcriptional regulator n=1 Tax=Sphingomonas horti TaxID=2682842 RepID=A0A6I4IZG0_9SPHN|nr:MULTISPECIES: TetR/AcrR family transcriptional regulator [Sphingomonas]MBA2920619.1 TetR/AcrR family transcriptional regulator [Sphingomonas sp. CGMCC 1.13658]MVO77555.1 TetR family transcriptional regulator [Sphingomonas horti]
MQKTGDSSSAATPGAKQPRTERGRRTLRAILDAAAVEFGDRGFHETGIIQITQRAGVALGTFYTYFDSKEDVFRALVRDFSDKVREGAGRALADATDQIDAERRGLDWFLHFARQHKEIYRIIDQAEFVDQDSFRFHYETTVGRIRKRLEAAAARGEVRADVGEIHAWAIGGMNVFLGLRYGVWSDKEDLSEIARIANDFVANGLAPK